jgi:hypothetical protein
MFQELTAHSLTSGNPRVPQPVQSGLQARNLLRCSIFKSSAISSGVSSMTLLFSAMRAGLIDLGKTGHAATEIKICRKLMWHLLTCYAAGVGPDRDEDTRRMHAVCLCYLGHGRVWHSISHMRSAIQHWTIGSHQLEVESYRTPEGNMQ